jgi:hypothetical protein
MGYIEDLGSTILVKVQDTKKLQIAIIHYFGKVLPENLLKVHTSDNSDSFVGFTSETSSTNNITREVGITGSLKFEDKTEYIIQSRRSFVLRLRLGLQCLGLPPKDSFLLIMNILFFKEEKAYYASENKMFLVLAINHYAML